MAHYHEIDKSKLEGEKISIEIITTFAESNLFLTGLSLLES